MRRGWTSGVPLRIGVRSSIGQREGLQALVVSAKRSQAESIALLSSLGVAPR
jgi:hypothetical protein